MSINELMKKLDSIGIKLFLKEGNLDIEAPRNVMTDELLIEIKNKKQEIIKLLQNEEMTSNRFKLSQIKRAEQREFYPVTNAQKRILVMHELDESKMNYQLINAILIEGSLDVDRLKTALEKVVDIHDSLRTAFVLKDNEYVQKIYEKVDIRLTECECEESDLRSEIKIFTKPMNLSKAPLLHVKLIKLGVDKYVFLINLHHIICDGTSITILIRDILTLYAGLDLPPAKIQYRDVALWQQEMKGTKAYKDQEEYWLNRFSDEIPALDLSADFISAGTISSEGGRLVFPIDSDLEQKIRMTAKSNHATIYMVLLAAYNILLHKYTGQDDIIVGSSITNRNHIDLQNVMGIMVNSLAMSNKPEGNKTFTNFLKEVRINALEAYKNQEYQFDDLVDKLRVEKDRNNNPLFGTMFEYHNLEKRKYEVSGLQISMLEIEDAAARFDIELNIIMNNSEMAGALYYSKKKFLKETMERLITHYIQILKQVTEEPNRRIKDINILLEKEKYQILTEFNQTRKELPIEKTVIDLFEKQVVLRPDSIAIECGNEKLTYLELSKKVDQTAEFLTLDLSLGKEELVAILMERSINMLVSILGVWKAGGSYVPIDVAYPKNRIQTILEDAGVRIVFSKRKYKNLVEEMQNNCSDLNRVLYVDWENRSEGMHSSESVNDKIYYGISELSRYGGRKVFNRSEPNSLAYVIYTSGSTGKPKGAMIEEIGMVNHLFSKINDLKLDSESVIAQNSSHCFDISVWQYISALIVGGKTIIYSNELVMEAEKFIDKVIHDKVTILEMVPSYLRILLDIMANKTLPFNSIRYLLVTGEVLPHPLVKRWLSKYPDIPLVNAYGPTEASDDITHNIIYEIPESKSISLGKPIQNLKIYIVNKSMQLCPIGIKGEIVVAGIGVGRGYLNNPKKTAEVFTTDPFCLTEKVRLYHTGDIGRWLPDGTIEYFSRVDDQVKIRGFRIELGEIERVMMQCKGVKEAAVVVKGRENIYAYVVLEGGKGISDIKLEIRNRLPDYMIPSHFIVMNKMPLTSNGKLNKKALLEHQTENLISYELETPMKETEEVLVKLYCKVLNLEKIGVTEDFFDLGGDSLKAIILISKIREQGWDIDIGTFFMEPTVRGIASNIEKAQDSDVPSCVEGEVSLMPIQKWFFEQNFTDSNYFNRSYLLYKRDGFDYNMLRTVFQAIWSHHDALRMTYRLEEGSIVPYILGLADCTPDLEIIETKECDLAVETEKANKSMDLHSGALMKIRVFRTESGDYLHFVVHRIIADSISIRIILEDFVLGCNCYVQNTPIKLPAKTTSLSKWVDLLQEYGSRPEIRKDIDYWNQIEQMEVLPIIKGAENTVHSENLAKKTMLIQNLGNEATHKLLYNAPKAYNVEAVDILLTALYISLQEWTGNNVFKLYMGGHGRERIFPDADVSRTVGWFTSQYPFILATKISSSYQEIIDAIRQKRKEIPADGLGYGVFRYLQNGQVLQIGKEPEICFNYLSEVYNNNTFDFNGMFEISDNQGASAISPRMERHFPLDIICGIREGSLRVDIHFCECEFPKDMVSNFLNRFLIHLKKLLEV